MKTLKYQEEVKMNNETYETPKFEIIEFCTEDILCTSNLYDYLEGCEDILQG